MADVLREVKSVSCGWVHDTFPELDAFAWQDGCEAFSTSQSVMPKVVQYIRRQQDHHKKMTFEEEMARLLKEHGISFDPRYI